MTLPHRCVTLFLFIMSAVPAAQAQLMRADRTAVDGDYPVDDLATVNFYLAEPDYFGCGTFDDEVTTECEDVVSAPVPGVAFLWILFNRACELPDGIHGIELYIAHRDLDVWDWVNCTGGGQVQSEGWPEESVSGIIVFWPGDCYRPIGENAKVGFITLGNGASGTIDIVGSPIHGEVLYQTCPRDIYSIPPQNWGGADLAMGTSPVCAACPGTPTRHVSWAAIKDWYR